VNKYLVAELRSLAERQQMSDVLDHVETQRGGQVGLAQA